MHDGFFPAIVAIVGPHHVLTELGLFFSKLAVVTFGGAYAVLPYVYQGAVETFGWLTAVQMIDVHLPTTDGRNLILPRYTQPEKDLQLLLLQLNLMLPDQPPPRLEELKKKCGADL